MIIDSIESLKFLQLPQGIKVISFDIFDTVLIRRVEPPEKTKELSCKKAVRDGVINCSSAELLALREETEERLKKQSLSEGKDREFSVCDAFSEIASNFKEANREAVASKLLDIELEIEKTVLTPMPGIENILHSLSQKYLSIAVSDTYLTSEMLHNILKHFGLDSYFRRIYASSCYKLSKSSGNLFKCILEAENIKHHELQHIGDNFLSDYFIPKKMGVKTICLNDKWNFSRKHALHIANKLGTGSDFWSNYSKLLNLLSAHKPSDSKDDLLYNFGYVFISPLLTVFTHLLLLEVTKKEIDNIFFIARDGFILKRIFALFANTLSAGREAFNIRYLCISRYTAVLASVDKLTEREWRYTTRLASTVKDVLTRLGVTIGEAGSFLNEYHLSHESRITEHGTLESLRELFNDKRFSGVVLEKTTPMRDRLRQYLDQRGFMKSQKTALVDIGWRGVIQDSLLHTFGNDKDFPETYGYYLALNPPVLPTSSKKYGLVYDYRHTYPEEMFISLFKEVLELSCKAFHGTTVNYAENHMGKVLPVFDKSPLYKTGEANINSNILQIQRGIIDFSKDYLSSIQIYDIDPQGLKYALVKLYDHLVSRPLEEHIEAMNQIIYTEDFGTGRVKPIVRQFSYSDVLNPHKFAKNLIEVPWREASLESSGLSVMNLLYYFAKRMVCCYRIIKNANT